MKLSAKLRFIYPDDNSQGGINYGHEIGHWQASVIILILALFLKSSGIRSRIGFLMLVLVSGVCLVFSMTKSAWLGLAFGLLYVSYRQYVSKLFVIRGNMFNLSRQGIVVPSLMVGAPVLVGLFVWLVVFPPNTRQLIVLAFSFQDVTSLHRLEIWQNLAAVIHDYFFLGVGLGNLVAGGFSADPHNWWLGILAEAGIVGFGLYVLAYSAIVWLVDGRSRNISKDMQFLAVGSNAALLSIGVAGFFEMSFMWSVNTWFVIGLALFFTKARQSGEMVTV
jgi:O-antigen ligase